MPPVRFGSDSSWVSRFVRLYPQRQGKRLPSGCAKGVTDWPLSGQSSDQCTSPARAGKDPDAMRQWGRESFSRAGDSDGGSAPTFGRPSKYRTSLWSAQAGGCDKRWRRALLRKPSPCSPAPGTIPVAVVTVQGPVAGPEAPQTPAGALETAPPGGISGGNLRGEPRRALRTRPVRMTVPDA